MLRADDKDLDHVLGRVDRAPYEAKAGGRDRVLAADSV
jgi:PleD family two-component response regulator